MHVSLQTVDLKKYISQQLDNIFPDGYAFSGSDVDQALALALERTEHCFKHITLPTYCDENGQAIFSHMHSDQYCQFLYYLCNSLWRLSQNKRLCDKIMYLNRVLHGLFYSYKGRLPDIFLLGHPVGTVIGNAAYSDFLVIFQNVTINTEIDADGSPAPKLGRGLFLATGSKIVGNKEIGDRVSLGVDTLVYNTELPDDSVVIRKDSGEISIHQRKKEKCMAQRYFNVRIE